MKKFSLFFAITLILTTINNCHSSENSKYVWKGDGTVKFSNGRTIHLDLQGVQKAIEFDNRLFLIGDKIDKEGLNTPNIVAVQDELTPTQYWPFSSILNDLFVYRGKLHTNDYSGTVYFLKEGQWQKSDLSFQVDTRIVFSDKQEKLIACYPAPMQKEATSRDGGCFSLNPGWHNHFIWFANTPQICGTMLYVYEKKIPKGGTAKALSMETGQAIYEKPMAKPPKDLCTIKLNQ